MMLRSLDAVSGLSWCWGRRCVLRDTGVVGRLWGDVACRVALIACACLFFCFLDVAHVSVGRWLLRLCLCGVVLGRGRVRGLARWRKRRSARAVVYWK